MLASSLKLWMASGFMKVYPKKRQIYRHQDRLTAGTFNWCVVPFSGQDAILFASVAVAVACLAQGRYSNSIILLIGAAVQGFVLPYNLGRFGNGVAIWLGIQPYELFFYIFLPPLLLDAAVRIDFYLFKKVIVQVITLAFLVVGGSVGFMIPVMLYILDLKSSGWNWQYVSLFVSMLASTDAVAIIATMKTSGGPKRLRVLLEGEALLNDASSFTLFEIFLHLVEQYNGPEYHEQSGWSIFGEIIKQALKLGFGGLGVGLAFGIACRYLLRFMRMMGAGIDQQVSLTLALAYMSYYVANSPCHVSGVVSVACFGLYGAATSKWDMSAKVEESGAFDAFWDTLSFVCNGIVFFFSGVACINFFVRTSQDLEAANHGAILASTLWRLPLIYLAMFIARFVLTTMFRPMFKIFLGDMGWKETTFATAAGLRGSVSLILAQAVVTDEQAATNDKNRVIKSEIVLWTAGFVLLTLLVNGSSLPFILRKTGLSKVSEGKLAMRKRATKALSSHTLTSINHLKADEDEMLRGVDWEAVEKSTDVGGDTYIHFIDPCQTSGGNKPTWYARLWAFLCCHARSARKAEAKAQPTRKLLGEVGGLEGPAFFGRTKGWGNSPVDLETGFFDDGVLEKNSSSFDEESSSNEAANDLTVGSEFPFFGKQENSAESASKVVAPQSKMKRTSTFANLMRSASKKVGASEDQQGPAKSDKEIKSEQEGNSHVGAGPTATIVEPENTEFPIHQARKHDDTARDKGGNDDGIPESPRAKNAYIMTPAGALMAPHRVSRSKDDSKHGAETPPTLRITGDELQKLVQNGTTDKTWPKLAKDSARPPLPFKKQASNSGSPRADQEMNEQSNKTWSANTSYNDTGRMTSPTSTMTRQSRNKRPSLFDAFDIERPATASAQRAAAKHKNIYDAFGVTDNQSSLNKDSGASLGTRHNSSSPQSTWTAGMTRGTMPAELRQALQNQNRASDSPKDRSIGRPNSDPAALRRQHSDPSSSHPLDVLNQRLSQPGQDEASTSLGYKDGNTLMSDSGGGPSSGDYQDFNDLTSTHTAAAALGAIMSEAEVVESRVRLIGGMKRYFHGKRLEGLLSNPALRILDNACDASIEDPHSLDMWDKIEKDATGAFWLRTLSQQTFYWRKAVLALKRRKTSDYRLFFYTRRAMAAPLIYAIRFLQHILTKRMLIGIEVSIEYMLSLTYSPHVLLLRQHERASIVIDEIQDELDKVWKFIMDREVEAPERFRAIQTYRASMAVLKQQAAFIKSMYNSGLVDDQEHDELLRPIESKERVMERNGPTYQNQSVLQILHNLPFLRKVPDSITEILYRHGKLHMYRSGTELPCNKTTSMFVVTSGILKITYTDPTDYDQEYFLATGGIFNLYSALTGELIPGKVQAVAQGNALGRGPLVIEFTKSGIDLIQKQARAGEEHYIQIELDLMRLAAIYLIERMKPRIMPYMFMLLSKQLEKLPKDKAKFDRLSTYAPAQTRDEMDFDQNTPKADDYKVMAREAVLHQYTTMLHDFATSTVLTLPAGSACLFKSHMVLLKGILKTAGYKNPEGSTRGQKELMTVEYKAPFVFPYIPPQPGTNTPPARFVAGYQSSSQTDAVIMVCESNDGGSVLDPNNAPASNDLPVGEESDTVGEMSETQDPGRLSRNLPKSPLLRRPSLALVLNVGDTGEVATKPQLRDKKSVWWDNKGLDSKKEGRQKGASS